MKSNKHKQLEGTAIGWLYNRGCSVFGNEVITNNGYADAIGVITNNNTVYYIEAKASRSDLIGQKQKRCYYLTEEIYKQGDFIELPDTIHKRTINNDIDFFYFIVADGVKVEDDLYPLWGVINEQGKVIRRAKRMKKNKNCNDLIINIAHTLVYKVFGKMYEI